MAIVTNVGFAPASGSLRFYDENGDVVAESAFTELGSSDVAVSQYEFAADAKIIIEGNVSVVAEIDQEDYYTFNNEASLFVSKPWRPTDVQSVTVSGSSVTAEVFFNEEDPGATVCCTFYSDKGQMLQA